MTETSEQLVWYKVLSKEELPEGRVHGEFLITSGSVAGITCQGHAIG